MRRIFPECNERSEGGNERAHTAYVYTEQKLTVVFGEIGKKYCRGNVAYKLAGKRGKHERVDLQKPREELAHEIYTRHIARKYEESAEGEEQAVVYLSERLVVHYNESNDYYPYYNNIMDDVEYRKDREHEKHGINYSARHVQLFFHRVNYKRFIFDEYKAKNGYERYCHKEGEKHYERELARRYVELIIYV